MRDSYRKAMMLLVELREKSDEELMNIARRWIDGEESDPMKAEFAARELRRRRYRMTIAFVKEERLI